MGRALLLWDLSFGSAAESQLTTAGVRVHALQLLAGAGLPPHAHQRPTIALVLEGTLTTTTAGRTFVNPANTLIAKPAGLRHSNRVGHAPTSLIAIEPELPEGESTLPSCVNALHTLSHGWDARAAWLAQSIQRELSQPDDLTPLAVAGAAWEILAIVARFATAARMPPPQSLRRVLEIVHARFTEPLGLGDVAREAGLHPVYLARAFRTHVGTSLGAYVRKLRVEQAAVKLRSSPGSIADIAAEVGFADQSHLTRVFSATTGMTPARYRREHRAARAS